MLQFALQTALIWLLLTLISNFYLCILFLVNLPKKGILAWIIKEQPSKGQTQFLGCSKFLFLTSPTPAELFWCTYLLGRGGDGGGGVDFNKHVHVDRAFCNQLSPSQPILINLHMIAMATLKITLMCTKWTNLNYQSIFDLFYWL